MFKRTASHLLFSEVVLQISDKRIKNYNFKLKKNKFCSIVLLCFILTIKNYGKNSCAEVTIYAKIINIELLISIIVLLQMN